MLRLRSLSKRYGTTTVVHPLDLDVPRGGVCVLIGPSGCGKSTLLRMIAGLVGASSGQVVIEDQVLAAENRRLLRQQIGYVIQEGGLFPHLTAEENVTLQARHRRWTRQSIAARVAELTELTKFPVDGLTRYPSELSGGQRQRVSLMRALFTQPSLLLLDEPLGALDPLVRFELQAELKQIFQQLNSAVLMVTHDMGEAAWFGDTIVLLNQGRVVQQGSIDQLVHHPAAPLVSQYLRAQRGVAV